MDKQSAIDTVSKNGMQLREFIAFHGDKDVVMAAVSNYGASLYFASDALKADKDVVMAAVSNANSLCYAAPEMSSDKEVVMAAVSYYGPALMSVAFKDKDVVLAAVSNYGQALQYAGVFKVDKDVALAAVSQDGKALKYAVHADKDVVLAAVSQDGTSIFYASPELKADKDVALAAVLNNGKALKDVSPELKANKQIVMAAVSNYGNAFFASSLKMDPEVILRASLHGYVPTPEQAAIASAYADNAEKSGKVFENLASIHLLQEQETNRLKNAAFDEAIAKSKSEGDDEKTQERKAIAAYQQIQSTSLPQNALSRLPLQNLAIIRGFTGREEASEYKRGGTRRKRKTRR